MKHEFLMDFRATASEAEVFWDLPEDATKEFSYSILADGEPVGDTDKTHFTLKGLLPEKDIEVEVIMHSPDGIPAPLERSLSEPLALRK